MFGKTNEDRVWHVLAIARIMLGFIFLWTFLDKLFGLGKATPASKAWIMGNSPAEGFLDGVNGPFAGMFNAMAGHPWSDWLFMLSLLGAGIGLVFGIAIRLSAIAGSLLMFSIWLAVLPIKTHPFIDQHLMYITLLVILFFAEENRRLSLVGWWEKVPFVKSNAWLR